MRRVLRMMQETAVVRWMPWALVVFAIIYYASYAAVGLNLGGEGGTAGVVAMRLMDGQRPIADTFLGYNVLWFFPIAWIFEITGPNYLVIRWYFFGYCIVTGLIAYFVVFARTRNPWYSAIPALLVILIPGMLFRNYMPFLGMLNAFLLTRAFVVRRNSRRVTLLWMLTAGAGLGLTFLYRIDLGIFCTLIFLGQGVLYPLGVRGQFLRRTGLAVCGMLGGLCLAWLVHLPFWSDAKVRGYDREFLGQYTQWLDMVANEFHRELANFADNDASQEIAITPPAASSEATTKPPAGNTPPPTPSEATIAPPSGDTQAIEEGTGNAKSWEDRGALRRAPVSDILHGKKWEDISFAISTYLPILVSFAAILGAGIALLLALWRRDLEAKECWLYPLTVLGCALTLFPQFFFFRPDTPHLSEVMVPFLVAMALFAWECGSRAIRSKRSLSRWGWGGFAVLCLVTATIYASHALSKQSAGTIAVRKRASHSFVALNGVRVQVREREARFLAGLRDAVLDHSSPGEFLLCLPYSPTINFMTDRPSPLYNLYVDNSTASAEFMTDFLRLMTEKSPSVVVIDQRKINASEASRFRNWARQPYEWLQQNYVFIGRYDNNEVFARKDKVHGEIIPEEIEPPR